MVGEAPNQGSAGRDNTTAAINEVARTMGGTTPVEEEIVGCQQAIPAPLAEQLNVGVEGRLCDLGVFAKRSVTQRQVLGCLACRLGTKGEPPAQLHAPDIARCHDKDRGSIIRVLRRLTDAGILVAESKPKEISDDVKGKPPTNYSYPPHALDSSFRRALTKPQPCGLEKGAIQLNRPAEDLLIEAGVTVHRSDVTRTILGCLACQLHAGKPGIFTGGVSECTGFRRTSVLKALDPLVVREVLKIDAETGPCADGRQRRRRNYHPADTELGKDIAEALEIPGRCGLESDTL